MLGGILKAVAGPIIGGGLSLLGGERANAAAQANAEAQMDFQERMSSTSYQRSMADMKAAGLNPMLAYSKGGASTPGGAMAPVVNSLENAVNSARQAAYVRSEIENIQQQTSTARTQEELNRAATELQTANTGATLANTALAHQQLATEMHNTHRMASEAHRSQSESMSAFHRIGTARAEAELAALEAQRSRRWGPHSLGRAAESTARVLENMGVGQSPGARALEERMRLMRSQQRNQ